MSSPELPLRYAAAAVVSNDDDLVLLALRSRTLEEYGGKWSFPSAFISAGTPEEEIPHALAGKIYSWFRLSVPSLELLNVHDGVRPAWRLRMYLYGGSSSQTPLLRTAKYDAIRWVDGPTFFRNRNSVELGDCSKAYLEYLDETHRLGLGRARRARRG